MTADLFERGQVFAPGEAGTRDYLAGHPSLKGRAAFLRAEPGEDHAAFLMFDNALVRSPDFVDEAWRAELSEAKLPLIVGVPNLVEPTSPLATLAVVPDHESLGLQAANLLFELSENDWQVERYPVELPLSVRTVVDLRLVRANFGLRPEALKHIDHALE